jgi:flagellin
MTSQINGLNQAARNAADGVSLSQTASGALSEIISDLQTMRDLAVQSLNATNSAQDRTNLDQQFQQLKADISNVARPRSTA